MNNKSNISTSLSSTEESYHGHILAGLDWQREKIHCNNFDKYILQVQKIHVTPLKNLVQTKGWFGLATLTKVTNIY